MLQDQFLVFSLTFTHTRTFSAVVALDRRWLAVMWPLAAGARGAFARERGSLSAIVIFAYLASKLRPQGLPVTLARPDTLYLRQPGEQQQLREVTLTCLFPEYLLFYSNKCISKHANNVKAQREILMGTNIDKRHYTHSGKCLASV